jgi:mono/diheme cytochrome c family protein
MNPTLELRALGWAVAAAALSLLGAWLAALAIKALPDSVMATKSSTAIVTSPELVAQGQQFFAMSCSHCHADDATGDEGPNLHNLTISNARIAATIRKGVKGEMPTFAKKYDDKSIAALVSYLRTLH